ncbi:peptide-methionine (S)-S-oxide reductase [Mariprofundus sp. EBB-1]|uniref:peptide-methionine (S)-S-oxide reductase MsrA n=1 Tax=Mariprofundus sp. EBB-1 TaxID=2650971 RepID=UPI000EF1A58D|nr:peptide-methionine (S)-S-oxide reductase MsrA [Mariprofundus sp. EBB-1]RLL50032.1 peptide-methionine (S)-S-oxide reductase [Mariprofundus sp. EBB-1]
MKQIRQLLYTSMLLIAAITPAAANGMETATFAAGCFWCMEHPFDEIDGVISTTSGYTGGHKDQPTYQQVSSGSTGHAEAVQILFDPAKVSYQQLLAVYWRNSDPTTANRQFCDTGSQYRPAIFYHNHKQQTLALASKKNIQRHKTFVKDIVTEIKPATTFWPAETYHQNYYLKNPIRYKFYRYNCGRDKRLQYLWGSTP